MVMTIISAVFVWHLLITSAIGLTVDVNCEGEDDDYNYLYYYEECVVSKNSAALLKFTCSKLSESL